MNHLADLDNEELLRMFELFAPDTEIRQELLRRMQDAAETHCRMGAPCPLHYGQVHGQEASELRKGIEILQTTFGSEGWDSASICEKLQEFLDRVDARDSLAFEEKNTNWEDPIATQPGESLIESVNKARELCNRKWAFEKKERSDQELLYLYMYSNSQEDEQFTPAERARIRDILNGLASFDKYASSSVPMPKPPQSIDDRVKKLELALDQMQRKFNSYRETSVRNADVIDEEFANLIRRTHDLRAWHESLVQHTQKRLDKIFYGHNRHVLQAPPSEQAPGWARRRAQDVRSWAKSRQTAKLRGCR